MSVLTVTLNPALDHISYGSTSLESSGGKGINVSRTLNILNVSNCALGLIGGKTGAILMRHLKKEKIRFSFVPIKQETRINFTTINKKTKEHIRSISSGPWVVKKEISEFEKAYLKHIKKSRMVIFSGSKARGIKNDFYKRLIVHAQQYKVLTFLDTIGPALRLAVEAKPFCLKLNLEETEIYLGKKINQLAQLKSVVKHFHRLGISIVLITLGEQGAVGSEGKEVWHARTMPVKVQNVVGCGDAFLGGFCYAYLNRKLFRECLKISVACGALNAMNLIPGLVEINKMNHALKCIHLKSLN